MAAGLETFAKVRALHDRTDSPGEKTAAMLKMQTLARKAGMSVEQAMSTLDTPKPKTQAQAAADAFNDFFNTPEMRAQRAERERERAAKRSVLLAEYGSEDAVWADTERETALRRACEPLFGSGETWNTIYRLDGWGSLDSRSRMPESVRQAVTRAWPLPATTAAAWAEYEAAEKRDSDRCAFDRDYSPHLWADARRYVLEDLCQCLPARSLNDIRARLSWMEHVARLDMARSWEEQEPALSTLRADIERMGARIRDEAAPVQSGQRGTSEPVSSPDPGTSSPPVQSGHPCRTNAEKRRDVLALLDTENAGTAPLTDREIARRAGVSPQTVGNIRRRSHVEG
ncbi:hypothetical protein ASG63_17435 [Methylobacterium sp. Leaf94]|uniref:hypothetical protein n=1 Tax=Methylobacterium sp. Leaf94 TaxID=1736250 RepID=UPI000700FC08|nr:hypothetical protein [Methylobacterium sp. Leaf94]KQU30253.1 hypothetical protein ASG63_17435 [Methylobacterium sp. Leaf94]